MAITPAGAPVWLRTNDHTTYGGHTDKRNFQGQGAVDPTSDVTAEQFCRLAEDIAGLGRVGAFATVVFQCDDDGSPSNPTLVRYDGMAGAAPSLVRNGNGDVTVTWATSYTDAYGVSGAISITMAEASVITTSGVVANCELVSAAVVRVRAKTLADAAAVSPKVQLTVWTGGA